MSHDKAVATALGTAKTFQKLADDKDGTFKRALAKELAPFGPFVGPPSEHK
jgi:hypothetical protein